MKRFATPLVVFAALATPVSAGAAPLSPLNSDLWPFPGSYSSPASATSAGLALTDRWLAETPFDNPAALPPQGGEISGQFQHVSRQDLHARNREFDEQSNFIDFSGAWAAYPVGAFGVAAYAYQPVLRLESNAFQRGTAGGPTIPAQITSNGTSRELRAGLAASLGRGRLRGGVAGEWVYRSDIYEANEVSGSPDAGLRHLDFSGTGYSFVVGGRWGEDNLKLGDATVGAAVRFISELSGDGTQQLSLFSGDSSLTFSFTRESGVEGGISAAFRVSPQLRVLGEYDRRQGQDWGTIGTASGDGSGYGVAAEFHDARDPWTARFGIGHDSQNDVREESSGRIGAGLGWSFGTTRLDTGLLYRTLERADSPTSSETRVVVTVRGRF